jgi:predicted HicB family RNase H-like nuclease
MVEGLAQVCKSKMQQNIDDYDRMLDEFEEMFMNIQGDLDFSKLKSAGERKEQEALRAKPEESKDEKRRPS